MWLRPGPHLPSFSTQCPPNPGGPNLPYCRNPCPGAGALAPQGQLRCHVCPEVSREPPQVLEKWPLRTGMLRGQGQRGLPLTGSGVPGGPLP